MRRHRLIIGLLIIVAAVRFTILLTSQTHVHSDEAVIGLMAKHIFEGRYFPFYMYGQPYNAGAAWEAYLAAVAFAVFGVSVISLKSCIVLLSLLCLFLFYRMCVALYGERTALLATIVFALTPSLLKWHFQVRGYSWYFLSIPLLTILFVSIESASGPKRKTLFFFSLVCGLSIWCLELAIPLVVALWLLLILRGRVSLNNAATGLLGLVVGYAPAIAFNLTHHFSNWQYLIIERPRGEFSSLFQLSTYERIFLHEMPKFFGPDTVFWYYPDTPASGLRVLRDRRSGGDCGDVAFCTVTLKSNAGAAWQFSGLPAKKRFRHAPTNSGFSCSVSDDACSVSDDAHRRAQLFLGRMFLSVGADRANVGTFFFFFEGTSSPWRHRRAYRDFADRDCRHYHGRTEKLHRKPFLVWRGKKYLYDTSPGGGHRRR